MICPLRIMAERLLNDKTIMDIDILQAEILVRVECPERKACRRALDNLLIKRGQNKRDKADPIDQEQDRKRRVTT